MDLDTLGSVIHCLFPFWRGKIPLTMSTTEFPVVSRGKGEGSNLPLALGVDPGINGAIVLCSCKRIVSFLDLNTTLPLYASIHQCSRVGHEGGCDCKPMKLKEVGSPLIDGSYLSPKLLISYLSRFSEGERFGADLQVGNKIPQASSVPFYKPSIIVIEDVAAMTGAESARSMFKFGQTKGLMQGIIHSLFPETTIVYLKPNVWKPALGLSRDKKRSLAKACEIFKKEVRLFKRVKDADRAEAALLAYCGLNMLENK